MNILTTILSFYDEPQKISNNDYSDCFKLPIEYLEDTSKKLLNNNIITDLELKITKEDENINKLTKEKSANVINVYNLYYHVFDPTNIFEINIINRWSNYYTNNKEFLLESQELLKNYKSVKKVTFAINSDDDTSCDDTSCHDTNSNDTSNNSTSSINNNNM